MFLVYQVRIVGLIMIYKKYAIKQGDTIQSIVQSVLGDASSWYDIANYNNLKYPYINRLDDPNYNINNVAQVGDNILIPVPNGNEYSIDTDTLTSEQKQRITSVALGSDLSVINFTGDLEGRGTTDETVYLSSNSGTLRRVEGYENLTQALLMRLNTPKGSLILHPEYGNSLGELLGQRNTEANVNKILVNIERTIRQDSRVKNVSVTATSVDDEEVTIGVTITPIDFDEQIAIYLSATSDGIYLES